MKVLCISSGDGFGYTRKGRVETPESMKIVVGEYYTVAEEVVGYKGELKYRLSEKPANARYLKKYFVPVLDAAFEEPTAQRSIATTPNKD